MPLDCETVERIHKAIGCENLDEIFAIVNNCENSAECAFQAFIAAGAANKLEIVKHLVQSNNIQANANNSRILFNAVKFGYIELQNFLLEHTNVDPIANGKLFILTIAHGQFETLQKMLKWQRTIYWSPGRIDEIMHSNPCKVVKYAIVYDRFEILKFLIKMYNLSGEMNIMISALSTAVEYHNIAIIGNIIEEYKLNRNSPVMIITVRHAIALHKLDITQHLIEIYDLDDNYRIMHSLIEYMIEQQHYTTLKHVITTFRMHKNAKLMHFIFQKAIACNNTTFGKYVVNIWENNRSQSIKNNINNLTTGMPELHI